MASRSKLFRVIEDASKLLTSGNSFLRVLRDVQLTSVTPGKVIAEMLVKQEHSNELGTMQGGMATTIVDFFTSLSVLTIPAGEHTVQSGVSVNLNIDFMAPIPVGRTIIIDSYTLKSGKQIAYCVCDIFDKETKRHCIRGKHIHYAVMKGDVFKDWTPEQLGIEKKEQAEL